MLNKIQLNRLDRVSMNDLAGSRLLTTLIHEATLSFAEGGRGELVFAFIKCSHLITLEPLRGRNFVM